MCRHNFHSKTAGLGVRPPLTLSWQIQLFTYTNIYICQLLDTEAHAECSAGNIELVWALCAMSHKYRPREHCENPVDGAKRMRYSTQFLVRPGERNNTFRRTSFGLRVWCIADESAMLIYKCEWSNFNLNPTTITAWGKGGELGRRQRVMMSIKEARLCTQGKQNLPSITTYTYSECKRFLVCTLHCSCPHSQTLAHNICAYIVWALFQSATIYSVSVSSEKIEAEQKMVALNYKLSCPSSRWMWRMAAMRVWRDVFLLMHSKKSGALLLFLFVVVTFAVCIYFCAQPKTNRSSGALGRFGFWRGHFCCSADPIFIFPCIS